MLVLPTPRPASGELLIGLPDGLRSRYVLPAVAARLLLADLEAERA